MIEKLNYLMKYIVFYTKNVNDADKYYIGVHKVNNINIFDGYLGDGVYAQDSSTFMYPKSPFQWAVKKYGVKSFKRLTLFTYDNIEEAYKKERELVNEKMIALPNTYNVNVGGNGINPIYQFDELGNLIKKWDHLTEACDYFHQPEYRLTLAKEDKQLFLRSYWSDTNKINLSEYTSSKDSIIYLYYKFGKLYRVFSNLNKCAEFLNADVNILLKYKNSERLFNNQYFISNARREQFIPKPRRIYLHETFHVYKDGKFLVECVGKELMKVINMHSWKKLSIIMNNGGNYKNFKIELAPEIIIPNYFTQEVDVCDIDGILLETMSCLKEVHDKYKISHSKLKNITSVPRKIKNYIIKLHNK